MNTGVILLIVVIALLACCCFTHRRVIRALDAQGTQVARLGEKGKPQRLKRF